MIKLDLGCGRNYIKGYIRIDNKTKYKPDFICDLEKDPLPYEDNMVDHIRCYYTFEHLNDIDHLLHEIVRVSKNNGTFNFEFTHYSNTYVDPWHKREYGLSVTNRVKELINTDVKLFWLSRSRDESKRNQFIKKARDIIEYVSNKNPYFWERFMVGGFLACRVDGVIKK